jgi:hypothetical protein
MHIVLPSTMRVQMFVGGCYAGQIGLTLKRSSSILRAQPLDAAQGNQWREIESNAGWTQDSNLAKGTGTLSARRKQNEVVEAALTSPTLKPSGAPLTPDRRFPVFPTKALCGSLGELALVLTTGTEVPPEFVFASALTFLGAMVAGDITLEVGIEVSTRVYTVLLGDSGEPKKSTALRKVRAFFESLHSTQMPLVQQGVGSAEGLAKILENGSVILVYDELRALLDKAKAQSSVLLPMIAALHEAHEWDNVTKNKQVRVCNANLSLVGCCTTETYEAMWDAQSISIGLPNRLFVVTGSATARISWPAPPNEARLQAIRQRICGQLGRVGCGIRIGIEPDALALFQSWYETVERTTHATRLDTLGRTLMVLYAITMDKDIVDIQVVDTVTTVLDYELMVRRATDPIDAENIVARLEEKIRLAAPLSRVPGGCSAGGIAFGTPSCRNRIRARFVRTSPAG